MFDYRIDIKIYGYYMKIKKTRTDQVRVQELVNNLVLLLLL